MTNNQSIIIITSYDGPYGGNFIASLKSLDKKIKSEGFKTVYIFQQKVKKFSWISNVEEFADKVHFLPYKPNSIDNVRKIRKIVLAEKAVLVYSRMCGWDIAAHLAAPKIPIIWHMEMNPNLSIPIKRLKYFGKYRIIGRKNVYSVSVSEPGCESLNSLKLNNPCVSIPNAADFTRLRLQSKFLNQPNKPIKLLVFGYNPIVKGLDLALDACEKINQNETCCTLMVSAQEPTYRYLAERYNGQKPSWLELIEPMEDVSVLYNKADVILSPSRFEGFSYCLLEALYCGLPAVYSDITGTNWADEMQGVYKFRSGDSDDLVRAINECESSFITGENYSHNRTIIESKYSMEAWSLKMIDFIRTVLK